MVFVGLGEFVGRYCWKNSIWGHFGAQKRVFAVAGSYYFHIMVWKWHLSIIIGTKNGISGLQNEKKIKLVQFYAYLYLKAIFVDFGPGSGSARFRPDTAEKLKNSYLILKAK